MAEVQGVCDKRFGSVRDALGSYLGWGGWGGSLMMVDIDARLTVSYVMNQMLDQGSLADDRAFEIVMTAYDGLTV